MGESKPKTKVQDKVVKANLDLQSKDLMEKLLSESFEGRYIFIKRTWGLIGVEFRIKT